MGTGEREETTGRGNSTGRDNQGSTKTARTGHQGDSMEKGLPEGSTESANSAIVPRGDSTGKKVVKAITGLTDPADEAVVVAAEAATGERENLTGSREMTRPRGGDTIKRTVLEPTTGVRQCPRTSSSKSNKLKKTLKRKTKKLLLRMLRVRPRPKRRTRKTKWSRNQ